jgi:hypothetical protein
MAKLQIVQNALARVTTRTPKYDHITPVLKSLHWLPIAQRIKFKLGLLVYKTLVYGEPDYLRAKLTYPTYNYNTRAAGTGKLHVPRTKWVLGERAFSVAGPRFWNSLDENIRMSDSLASFRSRLKTPFSAGVPTVGCTGTSRTASWIDPVLCGWLLECLRMAPCVLDIGAI